MHHAALQVRASGEKGRGVFTSASIAKGELIAEFTGWVLPTDELTDDLFALQVGLDTWLCSKGEALDDCINHSCNPNSGFADGNAVLFALRDIAAGEEISFDYTTSISIEGWQLACDCGASNCRGVIRSWPEMPPFYRRTHYTTALSYLRQMEKALIEVIA